MPVYIVANIAIADPAEYAIYQDGFLEIFARYAGELLAVSDAPQVIEGEWPFTRAVLLRFPDEAEARRWYQSPEYQELSKHRWNASTGSGDLVRGFPVANLTLSRARSDRRRRTSSCRRPAGARSRSPCRSTPAPCRRGR